MSVSMHNKSFAELVSMKELKKYVISDMSQPQARRKKDKQWSAKHKTDHLTNYLATRTTSPPKKKESKFRCSERGNNWCAIKKICFENCAWNRKTYSAHCLLISDCCWKSSFTTNELAKYETPLLFVLFRRTIGAPVRVFTFPRQCKKVDSISMPSGVNGIKQGC